MVEQKQAWKEMGLTAEEYAAICEFLGREPNYVETGIFAVLWSEHCSYKNSRSVLKLFPTTGPQVLQGPGENAGIIDIGDGQAVVFKIESHNHPSAIEPYQGAATGVGGIVRDIFAMGARPVAILNSLRFGPLSEPHTRYLFSGVVSGIADYGNCLGIPTVGGEVYFHDSYTENPLVNAMCVGLVEHRQIKRGLATGVGNPVLLVGAATGRDGIHGATFASEELSEKSEARRPAVQVGDPFMEKLLIEACLEAIESGYLVGIQDLGAAGLTSACAETASRAGTGMEIDVSLVPRRETGMSPYEVMLSESQERMLLIPELGKEEVIAEIFRKWGLNAIVVGRVTGDGFFRVKEGGKIAAEIPVKTLTDEAPLYHRTAKVPAYYEECRRWPVEELPVPEDYSKILLDLLSQPTIASKEWVYRQYDHMVMNNTVVRPGGEAAVLRVKGTGKGVALTTDSNSRYCYLDPYAGGMIAVAEAARNLSCTGARPLGLTDCLNFGNPEKPEIFWQFEQAVKGMCEACKVLGVPVVGGNVSFYNETQKGPIYPTPVVGMLGLINDVSNYCGNAFQNPGDVIVLLGRPAACLGASEYLAVVHGCEAGKVPELDLAEEKAVQECCLKLIEEGLLKSARDCAEGGLAVALAESCIAGKLGAHLRLASEGRFDVLLFGEAQSRIIVSCVPKDLHRLQGIAEKFGVPVSVLGNAGGNHLLVSDKSEDKLLDISLERMEKTWQETLAIFMR